MSGSTGGFAAEQKILFGLQTSSGPFTLAGEIGPGFRIAQYTTNAVPDTARPPAQGWLLLDGQVRVDAWLTPNVTLGVQAGTNLLRLDELEVAMTLGLHLLPFDRTR